jgi:organic hydroperoxide reductase OsmC/OhrA
MEPKKTYKTFRYENEVRWKSGRRGIASLAGKPDVEVSSPPEFKGEAGYWSPEDMFVASVNACTLLTFIAYAQREELGFSDYRCSAQGVLENKGEGYQFTEVILRPQITVASEDDVDLARAILDSSHMGCLVTRSIKPMVKLVPEIHVGR